MKKLSNVSSILAYKSCHKISVKEQTTAESTVLSAVNNIYKQFGPRSGLIKCQAWSGSKLTLIVFLIFFLKKVDFEKISRQQKSMQNYPDC